MAPNFVAPFDIHTIVERDQIFNLKEMTLVSHASQLDQILLKLIAINEKYICRNLLHK